MNAERLHAIAKALRADLSETNPIGLLEKLSTSLQNLVNSPQDPTYQTQVAEYRDQLNDKLRKSTVNQFPPTWKKALEDLGAANLFGTAVIERINEIFSRNQITPAVAQQELNALLEDMTAFEAAIDKVVEAFSYLKVGAEDLPPGAAELGLLIPRDYVDDRLDRLAKELREDDRIFGVFAELATGSRAGFPIRSISSSDFSVFLGVDLKVAACIAFGVERVIAFYKTLLEIRKLKGELKKQSVPDENLKGIEDFANAYMEKGIEETVGHLLTEFAKNADAGRKNELKIELHYSLRKIANRIDRGFNVEVRVSANDQSGEEPDSQNEAYKEMIESAGPELQFLRREGKPILSLPEGDNKKDEEEKVDAKKEEPQKRKK